MNFTRASLTATGAALLIAGCGTSTMLPGVGDDGSSGAPPLATSTGGAPTGSGGGTGGGPGTGSGGTGATGGGGTEGTGSPGTTVGDTGSPVAPVALPPLVTSAPDAYWQVVETLTEVDAGVPDVTVDDGTEAQTWDGFGASFNELGWSVLTSAEMQDAALALLFSPADGANLAWGRIPIGASDYARDRYSLADTGDDVIPNAGEANRPPEDLTLATFSLARDGEMLIPYIQAAQAVKPDLRFWASPWTAPPWMKTGFATGNGSGGTVVRPSYFDGGNMRNEPAILDAYARYFANFVEGYGAQGIGIEIVAPQNEPGYEQNYPSCLWDPATYTTFVGQHLGPAMQPLGVSIMLGTMSNLAGGDLDIANATVADATARDFVSVAGVQWGVLDSVVGGTRFDGLPIWATEHRAGNYPWNPAGSPPYNAVQAPNDQAYAVESWGYIRDAITSGNVAMYSAWNTILDATGLGIDTSRDWRQNALLVADGTTVTPTPTYYVFRHVSQYVTPGATVVGTTGGDAVAFRNPDRSLVVVMFNGGPANDAYVVSIGGRLVQIAMPGNGWATVKVPPA